jgi:hypothetical protein
MGSVQGMIFKTILLEYAVNASAHEKYSITAMPTCDTEQASFRQTGPFFPIRISKRMSGASDYRL